MKFKNFTKENRVLLAELLAEKVKTLTKLNHLEFTIDISEDRFGDHKLSITSNELVNYQYPKIFKSLKISEFNSGWTTDEGNKPIYWLCISYRYEHFSGGRNGSDIADFYIDQYGKFFATTNRLQ